METSRKLILVNNGGLIFVYHVHMAVVTVKKVKSLRRDNAHAMDKLPWVAMVVLWYWENMHFPQSLSLRARCQGVLEADMQVITGSLVISCAMTLFVKNIWNFHQICNIKSMQDKLWKENWKGKWLSCLTPWLKGEKISPSKSPKKQIYVLFFHQILTGSWGAFIIQMKIFGLFIRVQRLTLTW